MALNSRRSRDETVLTEAVAIHADEIAEIVDAEGRGVKRIRNVERRVVTAAVEEAVLDAVQGIDANNLPVIVQPLGKFQRGTRNRHIDRRRLADRLAEIVDVAQWN